MVVIGVPHTAKGVLHLDFADCLASMALDLLEKFSFCGYGLSKSGLEVWFGGGGVGSY